MPPVERGLLLARGLVLAVGVRAADGRLGADVVRSAEAGAWLRATLGARNRGAAWAVGGVLCVDGAGVAACGATTLNDAGANPPVGRVAVIV